MQVTDTIRHAIGQANASLYGMSHEMAFTTAIETIRGWSDDINDAWQNTDTGEITESYCEAEEWMEEGWSVRVLDRKDRLREACGRELVAYL